MPEIIKAACVQMNSGPDIAQNLETSAAFIREAAAQGAKLIATPENTDQMRRKTEDKLAAAEQGNAQAIQFYGDLAKELKIWLLIGSLGIKVNASQLANRSHLFGPDGKLAASYDKIHMFDVTLSRTEFYNESKDNKAGESLTVFDLGFAKLGMSICYDVRFPHLHRDLAKAGAQIITIPAAFTVPTGKAHWEILLRARAIETGSFVLAPAQVGEHEGGRLTYGHSMIIGPWGEILAQKPSGTGIITADLNLEEVAKARQAIPALTHDKAYRIS